MGEVETGDGDGSETGLVTKKKGKQKSTTGIGASLTLDYRYNVVVRHLKLISVCILHLK